LSADNRGRKTELRKYEFAYAHSKYRMGTKRAADACYNLQSLPIRGSYLDVSCGRGEMLDFAETLGFHPVRGTEIVPALIDGKRVVHAWAHALPFEDNSFNVVTMHDVIEHLIPGDDERACKELARVALRYVILTANNEVSLNKRGEDLHINKRPYAEWDKLFRQWFGSAEVTWVKNPKRNYISEAWSVRLI
jgi:SAM-dependent methyltransferase